jgi:hypothetical protein
MKRIKRRIEYLLENNWSTNNQNIQVNVLGHNVNLQGTVDSSYQKEEATRLVWNEPDVWSVNNELVVELPNKRSSNVLSQTFDHFNQSSFLLRLPLVKT